MVIAVFVRTQLPLSIQSDITNITRELKVIGVKTIAFSENDAIPKNVDLYWNPGTGRPGPFIGLKKVSKPIVVTFHGVANLALPTYECYFPKAVCSNNLRVEIW